MSKTTIGHCFPVIRGNWSSTSNYTTLNIVYYSNSSYICKGDNVMGTNPIDDPTHWQLLAAGAELSGNLTQEQLDVIVPAVIAQGGLVQDPNYVHTQNDFTNEFKDILLALGNGNLIIKQNNAEIGRFNANERGDKTVNISVPTSIFQLNGSNRIITVPELKIFEDVEFIYDVDPLPQNSIFKCTKPLEKLIINDLEYKEDPEIEAYMLQDTDIIFVPAPPLVSEPLNFALPPYVKYKQPFRGLRELQPGDQYLLCIHHNVASLDIISDSMKPLATTASTTETDNIA